MKNKRLFGAMPYRGWIASLILLVSLKAVCGKDTYYMDTTLDCGYIGVQPVGRDQSIKIHGKSSNTASSSQGGCTINFQATDNDATLHMGFESFIIKNCNIKLYVTGNSALQPKVYDCGTRDPELYFSNGRALTLTLHKTDINSMDYNFLLTLTAVRENRFPPPSDSNPIAVGLVIGIVGAVFGVIFCAICVGCCCFRKYRVRGSSKSPYLYDPNSKVKLDESHEVSVGYSNETLKMNGSPMSKKKLLAPSDSSDEKSDHNTRNGQPGRFAGVNRKDTSTIPPPPPPPNNAASGRDFGRQNTNTVSNDTGRNQAPNERSVDVDSRPKNSLLGALKNNSKFQKTFNETEADAKERAKRISSTDSFENLGSAPTPPSSEEGLERPALPPVQKSPKGRRPKHAAISRAPRPSSMSSDEMVQIGQSRTDRSDSPRVGYTSSSSQSEPVPNQKKKADTTHSLRPDRKGKKNQSAASSKPKTNVREQKGPGLGVGREPDPRPSSRDPKSRVLDSNRDLNDSFGSGRYKKSSKSPKATRSGGKGFSHRRGRSADQLDSRPTTPTSAFGSMEDLESLPPLQRASSKNSIYASRSSLYDRRGRRRKGSYAESVTSYATTRDDMSVRHSRGYDSYSDYEDDSDGYEKPLSRRDRNRLYRSENDLGRRNGKEIATQTLRETATQTGTDEVAVMQPKQLVKKRRRAKSTSTAETQTGTKKKGKGRSKSTATEIDSDTEKETKERNVPKTRKNTLKKNKRSKSVDQLAEVVNKEKPKPKPRPRKSTTADAHLEVKSKSASNLAEANQQLYYPQSEGFAPEPYNPAGHPPGAPPAYQGHQQPQYPPGQYPYPAPGMQQGYPPHMYQHQPPQQVPNNYAPQSNMPPRGRSLSNWELLLQLTDGSKNADDETGSVASSVFTNNPGNHPAYNAGLQYGYQPPMQMYPDYQAQPSGPAGYQPNGPGPTGHQPYGPTSRQPPVQSFQQSTGSREKEQPVKKHTQSRNESVV